MIQSRAQLWGVDQPVQKQLIMSLVLVVVWSRQSLAQPEVNGPACVNQIQEVPNEARSHIPYDQTPVHSSNPPVSGEHYDLWARWQIHTDPVPRGFWVHNMEHGAVVFLYRPDAPQALIDALIRVYNAIPNDDPCAHRRALLTADDLLDVPWAVTVSGPEIDPASGDLGVGYVIKADCIQSEQALVDFAVQYRNHSVEDSCEDGWFPEIIP
jgi:hypothetical protein